MAWWRRRGDVSFRDDFVHSFDLVVPSLDGYRYHWLQLAHGVVIYPVAIKSGPNLNKWRLDSEEELVVWLRAVFALPETRKMLNSLRSPAIGVDSPGRAAKGRPAHSQIS